MAHKKIYTYIVAFIMFLSMFSFEVSADSESITKTETYTSDKSDKEYDFPETIEEDGIEYTLSDVTYKVKELVDDENAEKKTKTLTQSGLSSNYYNWPETQVITDSGNNYTGTLDSSSIKYTSSGEQAVTNTFSDDYDYEKCSEKPTDVPSTRTLQEKNPFTGASESVTLSLTSLTQTSYSWVNDVDTLMPFLNYSTGKFYFQGQLFVQEGEECPLSGHGDVILDFLGLDPDIYEITSVEWDGDVDTSTDIRYARVKGRRKVSTYTAHYEGSYTFIGPTSYTSSATYTYYVTNETDISYEITATAIYKEKKKETTTATAAETSTTTITPTDDSQLPDITVTEDNVSNDTTTDAEITDSEREKQQEEYYNNISLSRETDESENNSLFMILIIAGIGLIAITTLLIFIQKKRNKVVVLDENYQKLGTCSFTSPMDITEFINMTSKDLTVKLPKHIIKKEKGISFIAMGEEVPYTLDGEYADIQNPNNYQI